MKKDKKLIGAGLLTAIASSLCCITPVLALISELRELRQLSLG